MKVKNKSVQLKLEEEQWTADWILQKILVSETEEKFQTLSRGKEKKDENNFRKDKFYGRKSLIIQTEYNRYQNDRNQEWGKEKNRVESVKYFFH